MTEAAAETESAGADAQPDIEARARDLGWKPKEEFKPREGGREWQDAETFVRNNEEILPIVRDQNRKLRREIEDLKGTVQGFGTMMEERGKMIYEQARQDLLAQQRAAAQSGDVEEYDRLEKERTDLDKREREEQEKPKTKQARPDVPLDVQEWADERPWIQNPKSGREARMGKRLQLAAEEIGEFSPALSMLEVFKRAEAKMRQEDPDFFGESRKQETRTLGAPVVDGGGSSPRGPKRSKKTVHDLPAEARSIGEDLVRRGAFETIDAYAESYFSMNETDEKSIKIVRRNGKII